MLKALIVLSLVATSAPFANGQDAPLMPPPPQLAAPPPPPTADTPPSPDPNSATIPIGDAPPDAAAPEGAATGTDTAATPEPDAPPPEDEEEGTAEIEIPPPETPPKPVLRIPESFPQWHDTSGQIHDKLTPETDYRALDFKTKKFSEQFYLTGYATEKPIEPVGTYLETEAQTGLPTEMQYIYVSMKPGAGEIGQHYVIVRDKGRLKRMNDSVEPFTANLIQVCGEIELTDRVSDKRKNTSGEVFRALIVRAIDLSLKDFALLPGKVEKVSLSSDGSRANILAQVIGSQKHEASMVYAPGEVVFINKGSTDGLESGQLLGIYLNRMIRNRFTKVNNAPVSAGTVKIVKLGSKVSTAVIVAANDGISPGDFLQNESRTQTIDHTHDPDAYDESSDSDEDELDIE